MAYFYRYSNGSKFTVTMQADDLGGTPPKFRAYRRSKTMMRIGNHATSQPYVYVVAMGNKSQAYYSDGVGDLVIPIQGWVDGLGNSTVLMGVSMRTAAAPDTIVDYIEMGATSVDGVSYYDNPAPIEKGVNEWSWTRQHDAVLPPNVIYSPVGATGVSIEANMTLATQNGVTASGIYQGMSDNINPTGVRYNQLILTEGYDGIQLADKTVAHTWNFDRGGDCLDMVNVRWFSLTGAWRHHYFPVVGYLRRGEDQTSLVSVSDGYLSVRDAILGVRCRIDGLTPYSVWYYADLLQANEVHASMDVTQDAPSLTNDDTAVNVEEDDAEVALVNGFYSFGFTLKMKQYDKV